MARTNSGASRWARMDREATATKQGTAVRTGLGGGDAESPGNIAGRIHCVAKSWQDALDLLGGFRRSGRRDSSM
jgi:hypothetical protein